MHLNSIEISTINSTDLISILEIEQASQIIPWSMQSLQECYNEQYLNLKLTLNKEIIGFCISQQILDEATLFNIAIKPNFQGLGYGKHLLDNLIQQLKQKKCKSIWLEVRESNIAAQTLYQKLGFKTVSIRKEYYRTLNNQRENAVIMVLEC